MTKPELDLDLTKKENWRSENWELIAKGYGLKHTPDFELVASKFTRDIVRPAKFTTHLPIIAERFFEDEYGMLLSREE